MSLEDADRERIDSLIGASDVTLFMKGNREAPQCGFSATVVRILDTLVADYQTVDVLADAGIREGIKVYSSWPTIPQLYVKGEFVGGCDIIQELFQSGELHQQLGIDLSAVSEPNVELSQSAADALRQAIAENGGPDRALHLGVDARYQATLFFAPPNEGAVAIESAGIELMLDPLSASRAEGVKIDVVETPRGPGFQIENPNAPQPA